MSATADGRLYIVSIDRIMAFDATTGKQIQQVDTGNVPGGLLGVLHCWSN